MTFSGRRAESTDVQLTTVCRCADEAFNAVLSCAVAQTLHHVVDVFRVNTTVVVPVQHTERQAQFYKYKCDAASTQRMALKLPVIAKLNFSLTNYSLLSVTLRYSSAFAM